MSKEEIINELMRSYIFLKLENELKNSEMNLFYKNMRVS